MQLYVLSHHDMSLKSVCVTCTLHLFDISLTFSCLDFFNTNVQAYFKGILFHYYKDFPCILIYCWKGNIIENLNLLNKKKSEVT